MTEQVLCLSSLGFPSGLFLCYSEEVKQRSELPIQKWAPEKRAQPNKRIAIATATVISLKINFITMG
jgi:hypothetical protein